MTNVTEKRKTNDLTLHELNIIYSLVRIGDWVDSEIGRVYKLSAKDVRRVFDNYVDLLEAAEKTPPVQEQSREDPSQESVEKPRKKRRDAQYATPAERQAAYRARLQESRRASPEQPSPANETDTPISPVKEHSLTICDVPVAEIGPEEAEAQHSACYDDSSVEGCGISESVPLPVTPETCSEREELRVIE